MRLSTLILTSSCLAAFTLAVWSQTENESDLQPSAAPVFRVLYNFGAKLGDPSDPQGPGILAQGRDGNIYSTTPTGGGTYGYGSVFKITPTGTLTVLYNFDFTHGTGPASGGGVHGFGTVFKMSPQGVLNTLHNFTGGNDGANPSAPPVQGATGIFMERRQEAPIQQ
jgi:uncharacterized repeat protein (TIGR03803 family)